MYKDLSSKNISMELRRNNLPESSDLWERSYNCWGLTAYVLGWNDEPSWVDEYSMERLLEEKLKMMIKRATKSYYIQRYSYPTTNYFISPEVGL
jgi:hypothetical protein